MSESQPVVEETEPQVREEEVDAKDGATDMDQVTRDVMTAKKEDLELLMGEVEQSMQNLQSLKRLLHSLFSVFDLNNDGKISIHELEIFMGFKIVNTGMVRQLLEHDENFDRRISFGEFLDFFFKVCVP
eukprot:TRINITY_DN877_c0_g1_i10.p1 TRINITY_DN877_c0_g1~~TRINITY_DN877_c0_g1_i10.p1  ORF type:complete len:145 (-),score=56.69 TRINITY_DN877_c0_g1_i10:114-500(-)